MKKRMWSILLTLCMVLSLLPATALADGGDITGEARAKTYAELVSYLNNSAVTTLYIEGQWLDGIVDDGKGNITEVYKPFVWPEGEEAVTLDLKPANTVCRIYMSGGEWTIPENVTVNAYSTVHCSNVMVIDGTWNCMSNQAIIGNLSGGEGLYGSLTVNGTLTVAKDLRVSPAQVGSFTLNGTLENAGVCYINNMTMADGAKVVNIPNPELVNSVREVYLEDGGSITGPGTGSASIGGQITVSKSGTLRGNLTADRITLYNGGTLTVADGADVTIDKLTCNGTGSSPAAMNVNGKLSVTTNGYNTVSHTTITLGENGVLALSPRIQLGGESSGSTIEGKGTLELYGILREYGWGIGCEFAPRIFGVDSHKTDENGEYVPLTGVEEETLTVKRMWDICTGHSWGETTTVDPTCGTQGYDTAVCTQCGTEKRSNYAAPTGAHTPSYTAWASDPSKVTVACSVCGQLEVITITATDGIYANGAAVKTATLNNVPEWVTAPEIVYTNNTEVGTATASATFGDVTIYTTFEIFVCDHVEGAAATCTSGPICSKCGLEYGDPLGHTGGTATCKERAVCTRCNEPYGDLADHTFVLAHNETMHWVACSVCGLDCLQDYGIESLGEITDEILLEMICRYLEQQDGGTKDQSVYLEQYGDTPSKHAYSGAVCTEADTCLLCGYGKAAGSHIWNDGEVTTAPTCTGKGVKTYTCSSCGQTKTEDIPALGHDLCYAASGAAITETCSRCDHAATAALTAGDASYTGEAVETASVAYGTGWLGGELTIAYGNNVNAGTAAASITVGSQTASVTFTIAKAAAHTLTLGSLSQTSGSVSDVTWTVTPKDETAQVKVEYEMTVPASPCTHVHDESCGENGTNCTHAHDASCGYAEEHKVWTETLPTEAGAYPVRARLTGSDNLELADAGVYTTGILTIATESSGSGGGSVTVTPDEPENTTDTVRCDSDAAAAARFTDVPFDAYYQSAVGWAVRCGVTSGVTETTFAPDAPCTRAQAVTFLWRAAGSPAPKTDANPFADVKADAYYSDAVLWAVENGITSGASATTFSPDATCTRAQIVTFLWRAQKAPAADGVNSFTDVEADAYYASAVLWAAENGVTSGISADTFSPNANCTRAQIVTFLWRCMGR